MKKKMTVQRALNIHSDMYLKAQSWLRECQQTALYFSNRAQIDSFGYDVPQRASSKLRLLTSKGKRANRALSSFLNSTMTNRWGKWFFVSTGNKDIDRDKKTKTYLKDIRDSVLDKLANTNFYSEIYKIYRQIGAFGNGLLLIYEDSKKNFTFRSIPVGRFFWKTDITGEVSEVSVINYFSFDKLVQEYGEKVPASVVKQGMEAPSKSYTVINLICRQDISDESVGYASYHILQTEESHKFLKVKKFDYKPFAAARGPCDNGDEDPYGIGPGSECYVDALGLNLTLKIYLASGKLQMAPPIAVPDTLFHRKLKASLKPRAINVYRAGTQDKVEPMILGNNSQFGERTIDMYMQAISESFFEDLLSAKRSGEMTATQVLQESEDSDRMLAPIVWKLKDEFLTDILVRIINILNKKKKLGTPTQAMADKKLKIMPRFSTSIDRHQRGQEHQVIMRTLETVAAFKAVLPQITDWIDEKGAVDSIRDVLSPPEKMFKDESDVKKLRKARSEDMKEGKTIEREKMQSETLKNLGFGGGGGGSEGGQGGGPVG